MLNLARFRKDIQAALRRQAIKICAGGIVTLFNDGLVIRGRYVEGVRGRNDYRYHPNLIVDQGIIHVLNVVFGSTSKISAWYLAPFTGSSSPAANWTAANFASNAAENTSDTEGYTESTRQEASFANATSETKINNYDDRAVFTIATASTLTIKGLGLLSSDVRGGTSGVLASATKFATARVLNDGDEWEAGYEVDLDSE